MGIGLVKSPEMIANFRHAELRSPRNPFLSLVSSLKFT